MAQNDIDNDSVLFAARNAPLDHLEIDLDWSGAWPEGHERILQGAGVVPQNSIEDETGRTYQSHNEGTYWLPNDLAEQARLDYQHKAVKLILDDKFGLAPLNNPKHVLDVATGTGIWVIELAEQFPDAQVIGSDLSDIQPANRPANCSFVKADAENEKWEFPNLFDYIHFRLVVSCFDDAPKVVKSAYDNLASGGYIEFFDLPSRFECVEGLAGTALERWNVAIHSAAKKGGRDVYKPLRYRQWLEEAGFVDVVEKIIPAPLNSWAKDPKQKDIGNHLLVDMVAVMDTLVAFLSRFGYSKDEAQEITTNGQNAFQDPKQHYYITTVAVYGRKP